MNTQQKNSKEVIYTIKNIKSNINDINIKKIFLKRKSDNVASGSKLCLYNKTNSNLDTTDTNTNIFNIPKEKKICIKFKDLVAKEESEKETDEDNLELALKIKKRRYTNNPKKIYKCNNKINLINEKDKEETNDKKLKNCKSTSKVIIGDNNENTFLKKIKRKILCCIG